MKGFLTFDYELFFGDKVGTHEKCILNPTSHLLKLAEKHHNKLIFFVDAGYLSFLKRNKSDYFQRTYCEVARQLEEIVKSGNEIQLHVHPHWEKTTEVDGTIKINSEKYKLNDFSRDEVLEICSSYTNVLKEFTDDIFAYRAGGWCIQPFDKIKDGLKKNDIWLDTTIYQGGVNLSPKKGFNFRNAPDKELWCFENDPLIEESGGYFTELPLSSISVSPIFYWEVAFNRIFKTKRHRIFGDGSGINSGNKQTVKLLTSKSLQPIFLDDFKSSLLRKTYNYFKKVGKKYFHAIGHPKCMSPFSLKEIETLMEENPNSFRTYKELEGKLKLK